MGTKRSDLLQPMMDAVRLLHPLMSRKKMLMVLVALERMGDISSPSRHSIVAGLLASQEDWERTAWSLRGACWEGETTPAGLAGRSSSIPSRSFEALTELLEGTDVVGIGCVLDGGAFEAVEEADRKRLRYWGAGDPDLLCFEHCVAEAALCAEGLPSGERVSFVMDWDDPLASAALWSLEDLKSLAPEWVGRRLGALGFASRDDFPPLQAAEWFADECSERLQASMISGYPLEIAADGPPLQVTILNARRLVTSLLAASDSASAPKKLTRRLPPGQ